MKFNFKIQPFQTEAVDAVIRVFNGQPKQELLYYRRDTIKQANKKRETSLRQAGITR